MSIKNNLVKYENMGFHYESLLKQRYALRKTHQKQYNHNLIVFCFVGHTVNPIVNH